MENPESQVISGLVLIDKPAGCTSHDIVNRWRKMAGTKRVGHLGTLDPLATGLLVLVSGLATRLAPYFVKDEKSYTAEVTLGVTSDTYDADGQTQVSGQPVPDAQTISEALAKFQGEFLQLPPPISAKKINGVPAYKLTRQKVDFELKPVRVHVRSLAWELVAPDLIRLEVTCSAGTYIRSIAHDLGTCLGCGALLSRLRRTQVADLHIAQARTLDHLLKLQEQGRLAEAVIPMASMLPHLPAEYVTEEAERMIRQGRDFRTSPFVVEPGTPKVRALSRAGQLVAIGELKLPNLYHPQTVF